MRNRSDLGLETDVPVGQVLVPYVFRSNVEFRLDVAQERVGESRIPFKPRSLIQNAVRAVLRP